MSKLLDNLIALIVVTVAGLLFYIMSLWKNKKL